MTRFAVAVVTVAALLMFPSAALADHNDDFSVAVNGDADLVLNETDSGTNFGFTEEPGEPLDCDGAPYGATAWYRVIAEGNGEITVSTFGSDFDTVLAIYGPDEGGPSVPFVDCQDDFSSEDPTSDVTFFALEGEIYYVQVGGFNGDQGNLDVTASGAGPPMPPDNDARGAAEAIPIGQTLLRNNLDATTEGGENLGCGGLTFGSTVWFRFTVPVEGDAAITASSTSMDPVVAIYPAGSNNQLGCNDDAPGQSLSSRLPVRLAAGEYFVQVGGFDQGLFDVEVNFTPDNDLDDDGSLAGQDCNDRNAAIRPGAPEVVNNDVDENCDGRRWFDRDHDGALAPPDGGDCDDGNPAIRPGARDVPGNRIDEDCVPPPARYPRVTGDFKVRYKFYKGVRGRPARLEFVQLGVRNAQVGATVRLQCRGRRCPARRISRTVRRGRRTVNFLVRFKRDLPPRTRLQLSVTMREHIGVVRVLTVRRNRVDDRALCLPPNRRKPTKC